MMDCPIGSIPYTIVKGDTLVKIAQLYNADLQSLLKVNQSIDPDNLNIGQQICIPLKIQVYPNCPTTNYYVVQKKDTFPTIANYFTLTTDQLYTANYGINPNDLYLDQILCIPVLPNLFKIIIDIPSETLTLFKNKQHLVTYPIQKETQFTSIPKGEFIILNKQVDPGVTLGARWLGLSKAGLGIQGSASQNFSENGSKIVLSNEDVTQLFNQVTVGTPVTIK